MIKIYRDNELLMEIKLENEEDFIYEIYRLVEFFNKIRDRKSL